MWPCARCVAIPRRRGLRVERLDDEPLCVVARASHPWSKRRSLSLGALIDAVWLLQPPGSPLRRDVDAMLAAEGPRTPASIVETVSIVATLALLQEIDAVTVIPRALARHYTRFGMVKRASGEARRAAQPLRARHARRSGAVACRRRVRLDAEGVAESTRDRTADAMTRVRPYNRRARRTAAPQTRSGEDAMKTIRSLLVALTVLLVSHGAAASSCLGPSPFDDIPQNDPICSNADWLKNRGVTLGCTANALLPPRPRLTRADGAVHEPAGNRVGTEHERYRGRRSATMDLDCESSTACRRPTS